MRRVEIKTQSYLKNATIGALAFVVSLLIATYLGGANVSAATFDTTLAERATHPSAALQPNDEGKKISSLKLFDGKLYSGYGDSQANTGPIQINPFNPSTSVFEGSAMEFPSESIGLWRVIDGKLYTPTIDPTCADECPAGYAELSGSSWQMLTPINAMHVFDIASLDGQDLWLFGSNGDGASIWRRPDSGSSWTLVRSNAHERYYWGAALNGSIYSQAMTGAIRGPLEHYDGMSWQTDNSQPNTLCSTGTVHGGPEPVVFDGKIVCRYQSLLRMFDGNSVENISSIGPDAGPCSGDQAKFTVTDDFLYILCADLNYDDTFNQAKLLRTRDLENWDRINGLPENTTSFEVDEANEIVYAGTADSRIFSGYLPPEDIINPSVNIVSPQLSAEFAQTDEILVEVEATDNHRIKEVLFQMDGETFRTMTEGPYVASFLNYYTSSTGQWRAGPGSHTIKIIATDESGNQTVVERQIFIGSSASEVHTEVLKAVAPDGTILDRDIILTANSGASISCSSVATERQLKALDLMYDYPFGMVRYCLSVPTGSTHTISLLFETTAKANQATARKYSAETKQFSTVPNANIKQEKINGKSYLRLTYQVTDGGELDEDGAANGTIVDPVGLGFNPMVSAAIVRSSLNGSGADLAATGMNRFATYALVAVMLIIGAYGLKKYFVNTSAFGNK